MSNPPNPRTPDEIICVGQMRPRRQAQELRYYQTSEELNETRRALVAAQEELMQIRRQEQNVAKNKAAAEERVAKLKRKERRLSQTKNLYQRQLLQ